MRRLLPLLLILPFTLLADVVPYEYTTTGSFSYNYPATSGDPSHLTFTGTASSGQTTDLGCLLLGTCGWANISLGEFQLYHPDVGQADNYDGSFTLIIDFTLPDQVHGDQHYNASVTGTVKRLATNSNLDIDFVGASQHIDFGPGTDGVGSFDLMVENPEFVNLLGRTDTATLHGKIRNAQAGPNPVPEPSSLLLLLTTLGGTLGLLRRKYSRG